jgi:Right handed beta helix region
MFSRSSFLSLLLLGWMGSPPFQGLEAAVLDVKAQGAKGDAVMCRAGTLAGSPLITLQQTGGLRPTPGMLVMIDGAGAPSSVASQDYLGKVLKVRESGSLEVHPAPGTSVMNARALIGSDDAPAFQHCVDQCSGPSSVISIPEGRYLLVPRQLLDPGYVMKSPYQSSPAVMIRKGGIRFSGKERKSTVLTACGAWQLKGPYVSRGQLFECRGPVRDDAPLIFENLTLDGGVAQGRQEYRGFPARTTDGDGWDVTHDAVTDTGTPPLHRFKAFRNCSFLHWRGEMLKSVSDWNGGFVEVTGCRFKDGNASAFNFSFSHRIDGCLFRQLDMAMEFYEGRMESPSVFQNSTVSDVRGDLVIVGALTNHPAPSYSILNNTLQSKGGFGVLLGPAENVVIRGNRFSDQSFAVGTGAGYQGTACNRNLFITSNACAGVNSLLLVQGVGPDRMEDVHVTGNTMSGGGILGYGWGWSTNVVFSGNVAAGGRGGFDGTRLTGQWFTDDLSNRHSSQLDVNWNAPLAMVSYATGAKHKLLAARPDSLFRLDDSHPEKIPRNAVLSLKCQGSRPAKVFLSSARDNAQCLTLQPGTSRSFCWDGLCWQTQPDL